MIGGIFKEYYGRVKKSDNADLLEGGLSVPTSIQAVNYQGLMGHLGKLPDPKTVSQATVIKGAKEASILKTQATRLAEIVKDRKAAMDAVVNQTRSAVQHQQNEMNAVEQLIALRAQHTVDLGEHGHSVARIQAETDGYSEVMTGLKAAANERRRRRQG